MPVNVAFCEGEFWQTFVVPLIVAVGNGFIVTVTVCPVIGLVQKAPFGFSILVIL